MGSRWSSEVTVLQSFHNSACPNLPWPLTCRVNKQTKKKSQGWKGQDMKHYLHCGIINVRPVGNWISPVDSEPASVRKMWWAVIKATVLMYDAGHACIKGRLKTSSFIIIHDVVASGVSYTRVTLLTYTRLNKKKGRIENNCAHTRMRTHVQSWKFSLLQFVCGLSSTSLTATIPVQHRLLTRYTTARRRTQCGYLGYANRNIIIIVIIISESQFMQSFNVFNLLAARVLTVVTLSYTLMEAKPLTKWRAFISATLYKTHAACTKK